jgi:hypothetical protein
MTCSNMHHNMFLCMSFSVLYITQYDVINMEIGKLWKYLLLRQIISSYACWSTMYLICSLFFCSSGGYWTQGLVHPRDACSIIESHPQPCCWLLKFPMFSTHLYVLQHEDKGVYFLKVGYFQTCWGNFFDCLSGSCLMWGYKKILNMSISRKAEWPLKQL